MTVLPPLSSTIGFGSFPMAGPEGVHAPSGHSLPPQPGATSSRRRAVRRSATVVFDRAVRSGAVLLHFVVPVACGPPS